MDRNAQDTQRLQELLRKYEADTLTPAERGLLESWYNQAAQARRRLDEATVNRHLDRLEKRLPIRKPRPAYLRWLPYAAAAAVALLLVVGWLFLETRDKRQESRLVDTEILPGGNRATLTLADGRVVALSEAQDGIIVGDNGISYPDGSSILEARDKKQEARDGHVGSLVSNVSNLMSISTPKGGTYQVTLPDGSRVWLNAASTLTYPAKFDALERVVELEGEAYFEVRQQMIDNRQETTDKRQQTTDKRRQTPKSLMPSVSGQASHLPFKVVTRGQEVEVLGTQFNISAYPDDDETKTTLVEGSVAVSGLKPHPPGVGQVVSYILNPGEQSILSPQGKITKARVNTAQYTAWKSGRFNFDDKPFVQVMAELGRWYNLDIVYDGPIPQQRFFGDAFRDENLSVVLKLLQSARIDYELQDKTLTIRSKE